MKKLVVFSGNTRRTVAQTFAVREQWKCSDSNAVQKRNTQDFSTAVQLVEYTSIDCQTGVAKRPSYVATLIDEYFLPSIAKLWNKKSKTRETRSAMKR